MLRSAILIAASAALTAITLVAIAGPLTPPAGPPAPTFKTLDEVEPRIPIRADTTPGDSDSLFKITQPGSYYLTGNITGVAGKHGIEITSAGVSIDLMGFDLAGVPGSLNGITVSVAFLTNITVRNGSVRNWGQDGVGLGAFAGYSHAVIDIRASDNAANGIRVASGTVVHRCTASRNGADGITGSSSNTISESAAYENGANGIDVTTGNTILACTAGQNAGDGIRANAGSTISGCSSIFNSGDGIEAFFAHIVGNTCHANGLNGDGAGIRVFFSDSRIEGNNCTQNDRGIEVGSGGNIIIRNTCSGNTTNWSIAAGNAVAPIVLATTNTSAIVGNTYTGSLGSSVANANFTY